MPCWQEVSHSGPAERPKGGFLRLLTVASDEYIGAAYGRRRPDGRRQTPAL